jgi:hypothetical protein
MLTVIRQARRRLLWNGLLSQAANAFSAALAAFIVLLLVGTQILNWSWIIPIPLAAAAVGIYRARKRLPSIYATAQFLDRRLGLADWLSTAAHFDAHPTAQGSPEVQQWQLERAAAMAREIDLRRAVPFTLPRGIYPLAALALIASGLFTLRYIVSRRLDFRPPLATMLHLDLGLAPPTELAQNQPSDPTPSQQQDAGQTPDASRDRQNPDLKQAGDGNDKQNAGSNQDKKDQNGSASQSNSAKPSEAQSQPASSQQEEPAAAQQGQQKSGSGEGASRQSPGGERNQAKSDSGSQSGSEQDSSLLSKVKDAFQNLLSRMKPQQGSPGSQEQSAANRNSPQSGQGRGSQNNPQSASSSEGQRGREGDASGRPSAESAQNKGNSPSSGSGKGDGEEASKQPGSGVGSQDGSKSIKQAEQLAAMGKISEIIGKRSANVTGQATVEVQSTAQQLHTAYTARDAQHVESSAEIGRDEVPVTLETYVEQYFAAIHKQKKK